jgi:hypothetical protein
MATTWNPADKHADITLANGNLRVTSSSSTYRAVRATQSATAGKWYYEHTITAKGGINPVTGIGRAAAPLDNYVGATTDSWGYSAGGDCWYNAISQAVYATYGAGNIIGVALDLAAGKIWFSKNGAWNGDPVAGTGQAFSGVTGTVLPMVSTANTADQLDTNFGAAGFTYAIPSGYQAWPLDITSTPDSLPIRIAPGVPDQLIDGALFSSAHDPLALRISLPDAAFFSSSDAPALALRLAFDDPDAVAFNTVPALPITLGLATPAAFRTPSVPAAVDVIYRLTLTGAADALADVVLPMASFQSRLRDGTPSYLAVNIPNGADYISAVNARPNGQIVVERGYRFRDTGATQFDEIARVDLDDVRQDEGARSYTLTLDGHRTEATVTPKVRAIGGASYRNVVSGKRRYRASPDNFLRPGDTVEINAESFTVGLITLSVSPSIERMEIAEA